MVRMRPRHRRWIALVALLGLLFQQLAMANYVCPLDSGGATTVNATSRGGKSGSGELVVPLVVTCPVFVPMMLT